MGNLTNITGTRASGGRDRERVLKLLKLKTSHKFLCNNTRRMIKLSLRFRASAAVKVGTIDPNGSQYPT